MNLSDRYLTIVLTTLVIAASSTASSLPLSAPYELSAVGACLGTGSSNAPCGNGSIALVENATQNPNLLSGTFGSSADGITMTMSADANSTYGVLEAGASASVDITGSNLGGAASTTTAFVDIMTVNFAPFTGEEGLLYLSYNLDGSTSSSGVGNVAGNVVIQAFGPGISTQDFVQNISSNSSISGTFTTSSPIQFIYGQPFDVGAVMQLNSYGFSTGPAVGTADANFSDTFVLSELVPTDLEGDPATGATFTSGSGTVYTVDGVLPEPSTRWLTIAILIGVIAFRHGRLARALSHKG